MTDTAAKTSPKVATVEPIPSTVVKKFYAPNNQMMEVGQPYVYSPDESEEALPYPWPLIRPQDKSLEKELREEYDTWHKAKLANINIKSDNANDTVLNLAKLLGKLSSQAGA